MRIEEMEAVTIRFVAAQPVTPNMGIHILYTVLYKISMVRTWRICSPIKSSSWRSLPLFSRL